MRINSGFALFNLLLLSATAFSQRIIMPSVRQYFAVMSTEDERGTYQPHVLNYGRHILQVSPREKVVPAWIGKRGQAVVKIDASGNILWTSREQEDNLIAISKMGNDIVAFYGSDVFVPKKIRAVLLNGADGKPISEKQVYETDKTLKSYTVMIQNRPSGDFNNIMLRPNRRLDFRSASGTPLNPIIVFLNPDLSSAGTVQLNLGVNSDDFAGSVITKDGDMLYATFSGDQFTAHKFNNKGIKQKSVTTSLSHNDWRLFTSIVEEANDVDGMVAAVRYNETRKDEVMQLMKFNFETGKVTRAKPQLLKREFGKTANLQKIEGMAEGDLDQIATTDPVRIIQTTDRIPLISEIRWPEIPVKEGGLSNFPSKRYHADAIFVNTYDKELGDIGITGITRHQVEYAFFAISPGSFSYGNRLLLIAPGNRRGDTYSAFAATINLADGKMESAKRFQELDTGRDEAIEGGATLWFDTSALIVQVGGSLFTKKMNSDLFKLEWSK